MGIKRDKRDIVFSNLIRERADWTCEVCGKVFPPGRRGSLHCSHHYSRRHTRTRWMPDNASAMCVGCHRIMGETPIEFSAWIENHLGKGRFEMLRERKNDTRIKYSRADKEDLYQHLKSELETMKRKRAEGQTGRIEFLAWD